MRLFALAAITQGGGVHEGLTDMAKTVADLGITIVICAVIVVFLFKSLNMLLEQNETTQRSVLPEVQKIGDQVNVAKDGIMEAITKHNTSTTNRLYSIDSNIDKIKADVAEMMKQISDINAYIQRLDTNIDSEQMMLTQLSTELSTLARNSDILRIRVDKYSEEKKGDVP